MRVTIIVILLCAASLVAYGQAAPSANQGGAYLRYEARYSQVGEFGRTYGNRNTASPSGSLGYSNGRRQFPFTMDYAAGYTSTISGPDYATGVFHHLLLSQGMTSDKWNAVLSDDVAYRPQTPTTGFSGIPGTGEPIGGPANLLPTQLILTVNTHALDNMAHGELHRVLNFRSTLNVEADHDFLHYPDLNGLDTNSVMTAAGVDLRINARNSLTAQYAFSDFSYSGYNFSIRTNAGTVGIKRSWTRSLLVSAAAGPEWVSSSSSATIPSSIGVTAKAALVYQQRQTSTSLSYLRQTLAGSGYMLGSESNDLSAGLSRQLSRSIALEMAGGYRHASELGRKWDVSGAYGGLQTSWNIGRNLNAFVNYTATSQSSNAKGPANILNETMQSVSCGIRFSKETKPAR